MRTHPPLGYDKEAPAGLSGSAGAIGDSNNPTTSTEAKSSASLGRWDWFKTVRRKRGLEARAKVVAHVLAVYLNPEEHTVWLSQTNIANEAGVSLRTVVKAINDLEAAGYVRKVARLQRGNLKLSLTIPNNAASCVIREPGEDALSRCKPHDSYATSCVTPTQQAAYKLVKNPDLEQERREEPDSKTQNGSDDAKVPNVPAYRLDYSAPIPRDTYIAGMHPMLYATREALEMPPDSSEEEIRGAMSNWLPGFRDSIDRGWKYGDLTFGRFVDLLRFERNWKRVDTETQNGKHIQPGQHSRHDDGAANGDSRMDG